MLWKNVTATSTFPYNLLPYIAGAYFLVGIGVAVFLKARRPRVISGLVAEFAQPDTACQSRGAVPPFGIAASPAEETGLEL
jgi:hypothetical protein